MSFKMFVSALLAALLVTGLAAAEESTLKEGAKEVGHATGEVVHKVGEAGKEVGKKVVKTARDVGHATRDGAKEFAKAVKGEGDASSTGTKDKEPAHAHKSATGS